MQLLVGGTHDLLALALLLLRENSLTGSFAGAASNLIFCRFAATFTFARVEKVEKSGLHQWTGAL